MITRLKLSTIEQGLPKYRSMLAGNDAFIPSSFESIASASGTGSSATITFSSIPSTYQHLQIRWISKSTGTTDGRQNVAFQFNSDTGGNYITHYLTGDGSSATASTSGTGDTWISLLGAGLTNGSNLTNMFGVGILDIHDYKSSTKNKTIRAFIGNDTNISSTNYAVRLYSGLWLNTAAITSIDIKSTANNFTTTTQFALYGIKGA